jgi:ATP-dependent Clp protease protease subunit
MKNETMLSADDMVRLGFATKKLESLKAVAYFNYKSNKMEKDEVKTFGEKLDVIGESIKALFSRLPATDQKITDKDGKEIMLAKPTGAPAIGDKATPDGTFVMADGKTIVISGGAITEVKDPAPAAKSELEIANEKIADLTTKIADAEKTKADIVAVEASLKEKEAKAVALITSLTALKNTWKPEARGKFSSLEKVGDIDLNRAKELIDKQKNNK